MKMLLAVMPTHISDRVSKKLLAQDYRVTKFADTSGFLSTGTTTLMIVDQADRIPGCLKIIRKLAVSAEQPHPDQARLTIYVLKVKDITRV